MNNLTTYSALLASILLLAACKDTTLSPSASSAPQSSATTALIATDAWIGKWNGPEGTFIEISGANGNYKITIQDLDGPQQFQGINKGEQITFERNGTTEIIQAGNGSDTGMKWLADKSNCLRVRLGEGWCKD